jgi:hypothetical protein
VLEACLSEQDIAKLSGALVPFAQRMLREHGEFYPFAATMDVGGNVAMVGGDTGSERPPSAEVVAFLQEALRLQARRGEIRACGICLNVGARLPGYAEKMDAICCQIEHAEGRAVQVFVPFRKRFLRGLTFDGPVVLPGEASIFGRGDGSPGRGGRGDELVPGGLYSVDNKDGTFGVVKLLLCEGGVAHIRVYKQKFSERPRSADPSALSLGSPGDPGGFGLGHMPIRMEGFLSWEPVFVAQAAVAAEELQGYQLWKQAGGGVW